MIRIILPETGQEFTHFVSYQISANFFFPPHTFRFTIYRNDVVKLQRQLEPLTPVVIYYNEAFVLAGRILDQTVNDDYSITISGTDHTYQLDSDLDPKRKIAKETSLSEIVKQQVSAWGFNTIELTNNAFRVLSNPKANPVDNSTTAADVIVKKERIKPQKAWSFLNDLCAKYGYYIQPGTAANILSVCKPEYNQAPLYNLRRTIGVNTSNNVLRGTVTRGYKGVPTFVQGFAMHGDSRERQVGNNVASQFLTQVQAHEELNRILGTRGVFNKFDPKVGAPAGLIDNGVYKVYCPRFISDKHTNDGLELANRVNRTFVDYFKNTLVVRYTVAGHDQDGSVWTPDTMVAVTDEGLALGETLYLAAREFSLSGDSETTQLTLIRSQSYVT